MTQVNTDKDEPPVKEGFHRVYVETVGVVTEVNTVTNDELREQITESLEYHTGFNRERDTHIEGLDDIMQLITADREKLLERILELKPLTTADSAVNVWEERIAELQTKRKALDEDIS